MGRCRCSLAAVACLAFACGPSGPPSFTGFVDAPVAAVAAQTAGRLDSLLVQEGETVHAGQILARLESADRAAAVEVARAGVESARKALDQAEQNALATVPATRGARADLARDQATLDHAVLSYERTRSLYGRQMVPRSQLDADWAAMREAQAGVHAQLANLTATDRKVQSAFAGVAVARAALVGAEASLDQAQANLALTRILGPFDGLVVHVDLRPGEWAAPGTPVVTVEQSGRQWVRLDVEETHVEGVHVGERAEVRVAALPGRVFPARVSEISALGDFAVNRDVKRGRPDIRAFEVRVTLDRPAAALRPGMTAEVSFPSGPP